MLFAIIPTNRGTEKETQSEWLCAHQGREAEYGQDSESDMSRMSFITGRTGYFNQQKPGFICSWTEKVLENSGTHTMIHYFEIQNNTHNG